MSEPLHYVFNTPFFMTQVSFYAYTMISEKLALNPFLEPAPQFLMITYTPYYQHRPYDPPTHQPLHLPNPIQLNSIKPIVIFEYWSRQIIIFICISIATL